MSTAKAPGPIPRYVYKILSSAPPSPIPNDMPLSDLDRTDGFIHLSTGWRVPITAGMYFKDAKSLGLLRLDANAVRDENARLEWADPGCVHMFAQEEGKWARMGAGIVVDAKEYTREDSRTWEEVLTKEAESGWLHD